MVNGEKILHLKPKEFELLHFLARNRGMALSRDLILERVWGWDFDGGSRTVDVHVRWLRERMKTTRPIPCALSLCGVWATDLRGENFHPGDRETHFPVRLAGDVAPES